MKKSFTLIELLVVVAIIGILVSILLPSVNKAREKAKIAICLSNLKQQSIAFSQYSTQNSGNFPMLYFYHDYANGYSMRKVGVDYPSLNPYLNPGSAGKKCQDVEPMQVLECPSDKGDPTPGWGKMPAGRSAFQNWGNSYIVQRGGGNFNLGRFVNGASYDNTTKTYISNGGTPAPRIYEYEQLDKKITIHNVNIRNDRDWGDERARWHNQSFYDTRFPTAFMDGHAEHFKIWWRASGNPPHGKNINRDGYH